MVLTEEKKNTVPLIDAANAARRHLLSEDSLRRMRLLPIAPPVARTAEGSGTFTYYFDPNKVKEAPANYKYGKRLSDPVLADKPHAPAGEARRVSARQAAAQGLFPTEVLVRMYYEPTEAPVAYYVKKSGERVELYDRTACRRLPLPCAKCGDAVRYRAKLCRSCYETELAERRKAGDKKRTAYYGMDRSRVLFFDLELTGVFDHDEILSVSIVNGNGETVLHTLTRPSGKSAGSAPRKFTASHPKW